MENFPSNSHKSKIEGETEDPRDEPKNERVVRGKVTRRKKTLGSRFLEAFTGGDGKGVVEHILFDVLIPAAKELIVDAIREGTERMILGEVRSQRRSSYYRSSSSGSSYTNYNRMSNSRRDREEEPPRRRSMSERARREHDFEEVLFEERVDAEEVLDRLYLLIDKYDGVTVKDYYELAGQSFTPVDNKWGWTTLRGTRVRRTRDGSYFLELPEPEYLS